MLTKPNALALHQKLCSYPASVLSTKQGRHLIAKAIVLVRKIEGVEEARILRDLLVVARTI